jgi:hypothetical protein
MSRFFLNLRSGAKYLPDTEGQEYNSLEVAKSEAVLAAREMLAELLKHGDGVLESQVIEITDSLGKILATVPFRDAIRFT